MSSFPIIATILSMVLGLSVTRLLLGLVTVFRIRRASPIDWVPLVWALVLFETQLEFWWAINQLPSIKPTFNFQEFIFLVLLTLMLFLSAALLLPSRSEDEQEGLRIYFEQDGRYSLLSYSAFLVLGFAVNVFFMKSPVASEWAYIDIILFILPVAAFFARSRTLYAAISLGYLPLTIFDTFLSLSN
ncbi:hypothetical protein MRS76_16190 [Rhizobiaceae bacterium n13]|uniref:Uncharacterized protein n=1 Tax=Ferirhizobium litorale TaxID=2927786 RepID=A0AAE3U207_9HYPH|nr:hypothetical protein [Fererhizobium litorale]MDI7863496.1 hypothetical protein [Fererhizobium litorale]MDI7922227.1 hypothetical protein [Fererhizobium litorale]